MTRPTYLDTHDRIRLKKWGKPHLVSRDQEKASLETECGRRFFRDEGMEPREDRPSTCADCRRSALGKPPRQHIPPGIGKLRQPKRRRRTRGPVRGPRPDLDADAALVGAMASTLMGKMLRFLPGRGGSR